MWTKLVIATFRKKSSYRLIQLSKGKIVQILARSAKK